MLTPWLALTDTTWRDADRMRREIESFFNQTELAKDIRGGDRGAFPAVNVTESAENVTVLIFAPGIDPSGLDVTIEKNLLTVAASRDTAKDIAGGANPQGFHRRERPTGNFRRVISLPDSTDTNKVEARYADGVLEVRIGKREEEKVRKIEVAVG